MPPSSYHLVASPTTTADRGDPVFQRLDVGLEFRRLGHRRTRQLTRLFVEEVEPRDELLIETRDLTDRKSCVQGFRSDLARGVGHGLRKAV